MRPASCSERSIDDQPEDRRSGQYRRHGGHQRARDPHAALHLGGVAAGRDHVRRCHAPILHGVVDAARAGAFDDDERPMSASNTISCVSRGYAARTVRLWHSRMCATFTVAVVPAYEVQQEAIAVWRQQERRVAGAKIGSSKRRTLGVSRFSLRYERAAPSRGRRKYFHRASRRV